jgi:hypothetical protein
MDIYQIYKMGILNKINALAIWHGMCIFPSSHSKRVAPFMIFQKMRGKYYAKTGKG